MTYKYTIIILTVLIPFFGPAQELNFLDELFHYDLSGIERAQYDLQLSEIEKYENDWGLTLGTNITNSFQEEIDAGLSARVYAKVDVLSGGYFDNLRDADVIRQEIKLDSLVKTDKALSHSYGIFYDYIIYSFNIEKSKVLTQLLELGKERQVQLENLYYKKLISYDDVIKVRSFLGQHEHLKDSYDSYNSIFESTLMDYRLPQIVTHSDIEVDFKGVIQELENNMVESEALAIEKNILDVRHRKETAPKFSIALGYDVARHRPYFGVNFSSKLRKGQSQNIESKKQLLENNYNIEKEQNVKELLNIQAEYSFKQKQYVGLRYKLERNEELLREVYLRSELQGVEESLLENKMFFESQLIQLELVELRQQMMLNLLAMKKILSHRNIEPYLEVRPLFVEANKFAGERHLLVNELDSISITDELFLSQNEIQVITGADVLELESVLYIDLHEFENRMELEHFISKKLQYKSGAAIVFDSLEKLKEIDLKTIGDNNRLRIEQIN